MHGSLNVCASVYRCICMEVYMYVRVFRSVYVCVSVYRCICMEVYMYVRVFYRCICTCFLCVDKLKFDLNPRRRLILEC